MAGGGVSPLLQFHNDSFTLVVQSAGAPAVVLSPTTCAAASPALAANGSNAATVTYTCAGYTVTARWAT